jgi:hypothetical protein
MVREAALFRCRSRAYRKRGRLSRFFTLIDAEALLPEVERRLQSLQRARQEYDQAVAEISRVNQRIFLAGGMVPPRDRMLELKSQKQRSSKQVQESVQAIQEIGCQLKDADSGLIDFPTLYHGKEVYLCWKLGETGIGFWHHVEDGFRGRRAIDSEFLANHRGDVSH